MAGMSRINSVSSFQGFSVFQPALGSALQWLPALGSRELDDMVNSFLPGPAAIQDKRAHIAMDFCEYSRQTGETFKFYSLYNASFSSATTDSPASSSAMHDSGYGSAFNVSPVISDMSPWTPSVSACTPSSTSSDFRTRSRPTAPKKTTAKSSGRQLDFSNHPGMRILTTDGRDVTDSASRGCKTKEQRDHAHLMRIIKACDACRRKKIRCDPSHKKRSVSQAQPSQSSSKPTKKAKVVAHESVSPARFASPYIPDTGPSLETAAALGTAFDELRAQNPDEFWQQFVTFEEETTTFPEDYDFFQNPPGYFTSSNGSSSVSPSQSVAPFTPISSESRDVLSDQVLLGQVVPGRVLPERVLPEHVFPEHVLPDLESEAPVLPYLSQHGGYGSNYLDFNLYSPASDFSDEEPQLVTKSLVNIRSRQQVQDHIHSNLHQQVSQDTDFLENAKQQYSIPAHRPGPLLETPDYSDWDLPDGNDRRPRSASANVRLLSANGNSLRRLILATNTQWGLPRIEAPFAYSSQSTVTVSSHNIEAVDNSASDSSQRPSGAGVTQNVPHGAVPNDPSAIALELTTSLLPRRPQSVPGHHLTVPQATDMKSFSSQFNSLPTTSSAPVASEPITLPATGTSAISDDILSPLAGRSIHGDGPRAFCQPESSKMTSAWLRLFVLFAFCSLLSAVCWARLSGGLGLLFLLLPGPCLVPSAFHEEATQFLRRDEDLYGESRYRRAEMTGPMDGGKSGMPEVASYLDGLRCAGAHSAVLMQHCLGSKRPSVMGHSILRILRY